MDILEKSKEVTKLIREFKAEKSNLSRQQSQYDRKVADYQHLMECCKFPAHIKAQVNKKYETVLTERRNVKMKIAQLDMVMANLVKLESPSEKRVMSAGMFKLKQESFSDEEFEEYKKYILPQFK